MELNIKTFGTWAAPETMEVMLKRYGVRRGDVVVIYMPMIPQAAYAMLACARI